MKTRKTYQPFRFRDRYIGYYQVACSLIPLADYARSQSCMHYPGVNRILSRPDKQETKLAVIQELNSIPVRDNKRTK